MTYMLFFYKTLRLKPDLKDLSEEVAFEKWLEATEKLKTKIKEKMSSRENSSFKAPEEEKKKKSVQRVWAITWEETTVRLEWSETG